MLGLDEGGEFGEQVLESPTLHQVGIWEGRLAGRVVAKVAVQLQNHVGEAVAQDEDPQEVHAEELLVGGICERKKQHHQQRVSDFMRSGALSRTHWHPAIHLLNDISDVSGDAVPCNHVRGPDMAQCVRMCGRPKAAPSWQRR